MRVLQQEKSEYHTLKIVFIGMNTKKTHLANVVLFVSKQKILVYKKSHTKSVEALDKKMLSYKDPKQKQNKANIYESNEFHANHRHHSS